MLISLGVAPDAKTKNGSAEDALDDEPANGVPRSKRSLRGKIVSKAAVGADRLSGEIDNDEDEAGQSSGKRISQATGALSRPDGLALVNVMLSRARLRTAVYSSIAPWEIDVQKMTCGMFLIASILAVGQAVSVVDDSNETINPNLLSPDWTTHRLSRHGVPFFTALSIHRRPIFTPWPSSMRAWLITILSSTNCAFSDGPSRLSEASH